MISARLAELMPGLVGIAIAIVGFVAAKRAHQAGLAGARRNRSGTAGR